MRQTSELAVILSSINGFKECVYTCTSIMCTLSHFSIHTSPSFFLPQHKYLGEAAVTHTIVILYCDFCRVLLYQHSDILGREEEGEGLCSLHDNIIHHLPHSPTHSGSARLESQLSRHGNKIKSSCVCACVYVYDVCCV